PETQQRDGAVHRRDRAPDVAGACGLVPHRRRGPGQLEDGARQRIDGDLDAGADVDDRVVAGVGRQRVDHRVDDVAHVHEVARLLAIVENGDGLTGQGAVEEDRDHARIPAAWILARAVDVHEAEGREGQAV